MVVFTSCQINHSAANTANIEIDLSPDHVVCPICIDHKTGLAWTWLGKLEENKRRKRKNQALLPFLQLLAQRIAFKAHTQSVSPYLLINSCKALGESPRTPCPYFIWLSSGNAETRRHRSSSIAADASVLPLFPGRYDTPWVETMVVAGFEREGS